MNQYQSAVVRITRGTGAGQERAIAGNTATTVTIDMPWSTEPDATSFFVIAENSWRSGASGSTSPIAIDVPERIGAGVEISARAANAADDEAAYELVAVDALGAGTIRRDSPRIPDVPPAPIFGVVLSPDDRRRAGSWAQSRSARWSTRVSIIAGTYTFHFYDEVNGAAPIISDGADRRGRHEHRFRRDLRARGAGADRTGDRAGHRDECRRQLDGHAGRTGHRGSGSRAACAPLTSLSENGRDRSVHQELLRQPGQRRLEIQCGAAERPARQRGTLHDQRAGRWGRRQ